ncbi:hypothetical protein E2562_007458 [Oryza meyeriana var. granulata]|uniref:Uncharacterized protein n=1 Tax=Oryza meyeriana var. granulata TaxID=110450 RepID=A0A6G1F4X2_9ORYZ|nr:hypothetical protein E2562_007458 [Oryza meyeriana var. granulata]
MKAGKGLTERQWLATSNGVELGILLLAPLRRWQSVVDPWWATKGGGCGRTLRGSWSGRGPSKAGAASGVRAAVSLVFGRRGRDGLLSFPFPWDLARARELGANGDEPRRPGAVRLGVDRERWVWRAVRCARRGSALPLIGAGLGVQAPFGPAVQRQRRRQRDSERQRARVVLGGAGAATAVASSRGAGDRVVVRRWQAVRFLACGAQWAAPSPVRWAQHGVSTVGANGSTGSSWSATD